MSQVFLSYRHADPDQGLADALYTHLEERGLKVFIDKHIPVGTEWVAEIDRRLRASTFFIVLLSEASVLSDMVRQEVQIAHELRRGGKMRILPIRVGFDGDLPYDLGSYLNPIQYATWQSGEPPEGLCSKIHAAIVAGAPLPAGPVPTEDSEILAASASTSSTAPLPAADPRLVVLETGTIRLDSPFYVRRREDDILELCLSLREDTVVVKGPRQSGKSSLLARAHALSRRAGHRSVYVDFQTFDDTQLETLGSTLLALAVRIFVVLETRIQPDEIWDSKLLGDKGSFLKFMEAAVLDTSLPPVVLILDEVDRLFDHSYRGDFFSAVRGWHNRRATERAWEGLHLLLGHATDPTLWIENLNESPFNVGKRLRLRDFTRDQIADLNTRHGSPLSTPAEIDGLVRLVGGHPYLVRQALYVLATERWTLADLERVAANEGGPFGDHLRRHLWDLYQNEKLRAVVASIVHGKGCTDEALFHRLLATGLVAGETRDEAKMRCALYQSYFARRL